LQGNRPTFGIGLERFDLVGGQFDAVMGGEQGGGFGAGKGQDGLVETEHFALGAQPSEGGQGDGRAAREQQVQVRRGAAHQPVEDVGNVGFRRLGNEVGIVDDQQRRRAQVFAEGVDKLVEHAAPDCPDVLPGRQRALRPIPGFQEGDWQV